MSAEVIESYLVGLGFDVNQPSLNTFQTALKTGGNTVTAMTSGAIADFLKFQIAVTGAFTTVGFGVIGFIEKLAMGDQQMRLFGMRSFMTVEQARGVQTALKVLGADINDVAWDKELHQRFVTLIQDQRELSHMLGPQYEKQMHDVRDVWFQLQRLEVKGEYFGMKFASDLLRKLGFGDGDILGQLTKLNDFVLKNMPAWSDELSTDLMPILRDFWGIMKDLGQLAGDLGLEFTNLVGVLSGDDSIEGATFDMHKFATAVEKVAHWLAVIVHYMVKAEEVATHFAPLLAGLFGGGGVGGTIGTIVGGIAGIEAGPLGIAAGAAAGGATGTAIGGWIGGGAGAVVTGIEEYKRYHAGGGGQGQGGAPGGGGGGSGAAAGVMAQARQLAMRVSAATGIPASLIFAQWAHETGGFTNRGTTQLNNLAGIRYPGSTQYRSFNSLDDFASFYGNLVESKRYTSQGINAAKTPEAYAHALKAGSYYEGAEGDYVRGMKNFQPQFAPAGGGASSISIGTINVPVTHPNATGPEIAAHVQRGVRDGIDDHTQRLMAESGGAYR